MQNKKLFVFDCDGTLLNDQREILPATIKTLNAVLALGHHVALCTGRNFHQLKEYLDLIPKLDIVASMNGGAINIVSTNQCIVLAKPVPMEVVQDLITIAQQYKRELHWSNCEEFHRVYFGTKPELDVTDLSFFQMGTVSPVYEDWEKVKSRITMPIFHIAVKIESSQIEKPLNWLQTKYKGSTACSILRTGAIYIDVDGANVSKFNAVKKMQEIYHVSNDDTYCFGDSDNDISMLKNAGWGICLANGTEGAKGNAKIIIGDNNSESISDFIKKLLGI